MDISIAKQFPFYDCFLEIFHLLLVASFCKHVLCFEIPLSSFTLKQISDLTSTLLKQIWLIEENKVLTSITDICKSHYAYESHYSTIFIILLVIFSFEYRIEPSHASLRIIKHIKLSINTKFLELWISEKLGYSKNTNFANSRSLSTLL